MRSLIVTYKKIIVIALSVLLYLVVLVLVNFTHTTKYAASGESLIHNEEFEVWADGYDADEQEFTVELKAGKNEIERVMDKVGDAPQEAYVRFFCLDQVQCDINDLSIKNGKG